MRNFLLAAGLLLALSGCSTDNDSTHKAVGDYIKKNLGEPASYQSVRWGKSIAYTRAQAETINAMVLLDSAKAANGRVIQAIQDEVPDSVVERKKKYAAAIFGRAEKVGQLADSLGAKKDSTALGVRIMHAFRAKNKLGALVLDSAQFLVYKSGKVEAL